MRRWRQRYRAPRGIDADGWLAIARRNPSPNCDERPAGSVISLLVVHGISLPPGRFGGPGIAALFCNRLLVNAAGGFPVLGEELAEDVMATKLVRSMGLRVPEDIAIIGHARIGARRL